MPERDGKDQREDSPKQACSCWFARHGCLATSSADLYPPGVWLRGVISFFCGVTFVMFLFRFRLLVFIKAAAFNFFSICIALTVTRSYLKTVGVLFYFVYIFLLGRCCFSRFFCTMLPFPLLDGEFLVQFPSGWCLLPYDHGLDFDITSGENSINQSNKISYSKGSTVTMPRQFDQ